MAKKKPAPKPSFGSGAMGIAIPTPPPAPAPAPAPPVYNPPPAAPPQTSATPEENKAKGDFIADMVGNNGTGYGSPPESVQPRSNPAPAAAAPAGPSPAQLALLAQLRAFFNDNGMGDLFAGAEKYVREGYTGDSIYFMLEKDPTYQAAYNKRFAANEIRRKNGLQALLPGTYVATEAAYRQVMISKGIPSGLFDEASDLTALIGNDVSAMEVGQRLDEALTYINYAGNSEVKSQLRDLYGLTDGEMASYVLDPTKTLDFLQRESNTNLRRASVGAAATTTGVNISANLRDQVAGMINQGIGDAYDQLTPRFANIAGEQGTYAKLATMSGTTGTAEDLVRETFDMQGGSEVTAKKRRLASQERGRFSGTNAITKTSLTAQKVGGQ